MSEGGWYGLLAIEQEYRDVIAVQHSTPPVACPEDGEPLRAGPQGQNHCVWCGRCWS